MADRKAYYKDWYEKNKKLVAKRRYDKYRNDPDYKEKHKTNSYRYYWMKKRRAKAIKSPGIAINSLIPDEIADVIISNENDIRCDLTVPVPMFYPANLGRCIGRTVQTIRLWALRGIIPEATYRNRVNYRLYTKDQVKVYINYLPLLKLQVKDFAEHPYFVEVHKGLKALEPDGIEIMDKSEWRLVDTKCIWCRETPGLEYFDGEKWKKVQCFSCRDPYDIEGRKRTEKEYVTGYCHFCKEDISDHMYIIGETPMLVCQTCGARAKDVKIHKEEGK